MFCQKCGSENKDGAAFCNSCGAELRTVQVMPADSSKKGSCECESCGAWVPVGQKLCSNCLDIKLGNQNDNPFSPKNQRIENLKKKIAETKMEIEESGQTGPLVLGIIGGLTIIVFGLGIIFIIIAIIWAYVRDKEQKRLKELLFQYEGELSQLQGI